LTTAGRKTGPVLRVYDAAMTTTGPRLPPLAPGEWDDVLTRVLENSPGGTDEPMHIFSAARFGGRYEWAQHIGLAQVQGVTPAELVAVSNGEGAVDTVDWPPLERAALRAVDETADEGAVSDGTWETLAEDLQESELIELLMLIGHYMMLTTVLGSLRIQLEPRAEALAESVPGGPAA